MGTGIPAALDLTITPALPRAASRLEAMMLGAGARLDRFVLERFVKRAAFAVPRDGAEARGPQPCAELIVEDSGSGIAPSDLDRLFEPFFTTKGNRGLGLGLAVTWGIVEAHGGTIEVQSEPGHGARFTVRLPFVAPTRAAGASTMAPHFPAATPRESEPKRGVA